VTAPTPVGQIQDGTAAAVVEAPPDSAGDDAAPTKLKEFRAAEGGILEREQRPDMTLAGWIGGREYWSR